jgi:hypothetical protein
VTLGARLAGLLAVNSAHHGQNIQELVTREMKLACSHIQTLGSCKTMGLKFSRRVITEWERVSNGPGKLLHHHSRQHWRHSAIGGAAICVNMPSIVATVAVRSFKSDGRQYGLYL